MNIAEPQKVLKFFMHLVSYANRVQLRGQFNSTTLEFFLCRFKKNIMKRKNKQKGYYIGLGLISGTIVGVLTDNIGLWLSLGIVFGAAMETQHTETKNKK